MTWTVAKRNYSICSEDDKDKGNTRFMFHNESQSLCPLPPVKITSEYITTNVVL